MVTWWTVCSSNCFLCLWCPWRSSQILPDPSQILSSVTKGPSVSSSQSHDSFAHTSQLLQQGKHDFTEKGGLLLRLKQLEDVGMKTTKADQPAGNISPQHGSAVAGRGSTKRRSGVVRAKAIPMAPGRAACSLCAAMEDRPSVSQSDWIQPFSYLPKKTHPICSLKQSNFHYFLSLSIKKKSQQSPWPLRSNGKKPHDELTLCVYTCTLYTDLANSWIMYF